MNWLWQDFHTASWLTVILTALFYLIRVIAYLVTAFALHRLSVRRRLLYPWLGWIPVIRYYLLGQLLGQKLQLTRQLHIVRIGYILPFLAAFMVLLSGTLAGNIAMLLTVLLSSLCYCSLFRQHREQRALLYGLMAGLPFLEIIGCFLLLHLSRQDASDAQGDATVFQ